jgi:uncharacterized protein (TIGR03435 family)
LHARRKEWKIIMRFIASTLSIVGMVHFLTLFASPGSAVMGIQTESKRETLAPHYEIASIRENTSPLPYSVTRRDPPHTASFHGTNLTLPDLITYTYGVNEYQIIGGPGWMRSARFDIEAKGDDEANRGLVALGEEQALAAKKLMLKELLTTRFHLEIHPDSKLGNVFELSAGKAESRLQQFASLPTRGPQDPPDGEIYYRGDGSGDKLIGRNVQIGDLCQHLEDMLATSVLDKTGMIGRYNMEVHFGGINEARPNSQWPILVTAVREQLGFDIKAAKGPIKTIVIDSVLKPSVD